MHKECDMVPSTLMYTHSHLPPLPPPKKRLKTFIIVTFIDSVHSTFLNKGFTTEFSHRMHRHWNVKLRERLQLRLTLKVTSMTREARNSI